MSLEGKATATYNVLHGKIHNFVIDKTLTIAGACADAKVTGDEIRSATAWQVRDTANAALTAAQIAVETANAAAKTVTFGNVAVSNTWTKNGNYYKQDVTVDGITADDNPIVDIVAGATDDDTLSYALYFGRVFRIATSANKITLYSTEQTPAFKIQLKVVR